MLYSQTCVQADRAGVELEDLIRVGGRCGGWRRSFAILDGQGHPSTHLECRTLSSVRGSASVCQRLLDAKGQQARFELNFSKLLVIRPQLLDQIRRQRGNGPPRETKNGTFHV